MEPKILGKARAKGCRSTMTHELMMPRLASIRVHMPGEMKSHVMSVMRLTEDWTDVARRTEAAVTLRVKD